MSSAHRNVDASRTDRALKGERPVRSFTQMSKHDSHGLVSIIINNYNYGAYLSGAIDSALRQTYQPVEVIVVDDGSTDASREIIRSYGEAILPVLKENGGQGSAFNAGLAASHGEIVLFLDSDDVLLPETLVHVVDAFGAHPDAAKVQFRMEVIDAAGVRTGVNKPSAHLHFAGGDLRPYVLAFPFDLTWMPTSGNAFRARVLRQIFPMPESEYRILADFYLAHITALFGTVVAQNQIGSQYRVHGANSFELAKPILNLPHIRQMIVYSNRTLGYIQHYAALLGLPYDAQNAHSVSSIAERMISLKLEPLNHPLPGDSVSSLLALGVRAAFGRFDASPVLKLLFVCWFGAMTLAPRQAAHWLAEKFYFPETRGVLNRWLGEMHASEPKPECMNMPVTTHAPVSPGAL